MKDNWFEEGLNDKLSNYESSMDFEQAWIDLNNRRTEEPKKRIFGWWMFGTLSAISLMIGLVLGILDFSEADLDNTELVKTTNAESNLSSIELDEPYAFEENNSESNKNSTIRSGIEYTKKVEKTSKVNKAEKSNYPPITSFTKNIAQTFGLDPLNPSTTVTKLVVNQNQIPNNRSLISRLEFLDSRNATLAKDVFGLKLPIATNPVLRKVFQQKNNSEYLGIAAGYGPSLSSTNTSGETPIDAYSLNLHYQRYFTNNIYVKSGINIDHFTNEVNSTLIRTYKQSSDDEVVLVNNYQDGSIEEILGTADVDVTETTTYNMFNRYQFVSIPVIVGFKIGKSKRSFVILEGGLSTTVFSKYDIKEFDITTSDKFMQVDDPNLRTAGLLKSLYAAQWSVAPFKSENLGLLIKYQGQYQLNDLGINPTTTSQKFNAHQIFVGMQYSFR